MIIRYPTGLYDSLLPKANRDSTSVTYTISAGPPPRANLIYPKIPFRIFGKTKPAATIDKVVRRNHFGDLTFSVTKSGGTTAGNGARQYEIGEILEFGKLTTKTADPMFVSPRTEIQHNNNILDYEKLGLTAADQEVIAAGSMQTQQFWADRLNASKRSRANSEQIIAAQQKIINESDRAISALEVMRGTIPDPAFNQVITKLTKTKNTAIAARDAAVKAASLAAANASEAISKLRSVSVVVK